MARDGLKVVQAGRGLGAAHPRRWLSPFAAAVGLVAALTALRVATLFATPLELYPDEAQYWLWSRHLAFGYFSKPPMIAWLIAATTAVGGNGEAWVRLSAPLLHGAAALALARAATRLDGPNTGFWAAVVYSLIPGVQLSSGVIATDAPLLFGVTLALWAYAGLWTAREGKGGGGDALRAAAAFGAAAGLASLAKYAGLYLVLGAVLHATTRARARAMWTPARVALAVAIASALLAPNLAWNATHHFQTLVHTAANADLSDGSEAARAELAAAGTTAGLARAHPTGWAAAAARLGDPRGALGFVVGQFAVFGPLPFLAALATAWTKDGPKGRWRADGTTGLLLAFAAPPMLIVLAVAVVARANANWAAAAYPALAILAAMGLQKGWRRRWRAPGLGLQVAAGAAFMAAAVWPAFADGAGFANSFKRARGWRASTQAVRLYLDHAMATGEPVRALAVDDRFLFNALAYYGRDAPPRAGGPHVGAPPLRMWRHEAWPKNQAEAEAPLTAAPGVGGAAGGRVVFASTAFARAAMWDFGQVTDVRTVRVPLDAKRGRDIVLFQAQGFAPRPRDARTGLPIPPHQGG